MMAAAFAKIHLFEIPQLVLFLMRPLAVKVPASHQGA